jgi:predicted ATP-dependent endonuclease of OLD family
MRLNSITTKNYRTLQDLTLQFSKNYCTISGRNNAGKSCVIRLLSGLFRTGKTYPWLINETGFDYKEDKDPVGEAILADRSRLYAWHHQG